MRGFYALFGVIASAATSEDAEQIAARCNQPKVDLNTSLLCHDDQQSDQTKVTIKKGSTKQWLLLILVTVSIAVGLIVAFVRLVASLDDATVAIMMVICVVLILIGKLIEWCKGELEDE
eukprot:COSAG02_NODE_16855_length_1050_cov_6.625657_1_plen_119_part_00